MWTGVEGWTAPIPYTITYAVAGGAATPLSLTGLAVSMLAWDRFGAAIALTGTVTVVNAASGQVQFNPGANDLQHANSPMSVRWKIVDGAGHVVFSPSSPPEQWTVLKP